MTDPQSTPRTAAAVLEFARDCLGPESERLLQSPEAQAVVHARLRSGVELPDAVIGVVFDQAKDDRRLADEFLAYFLEDLLRLERPRLRGGLRRFLDTGDLVQSVLGDLWSSFAAVRFENRARFISFLSKRLSWKAIGQVRSMDSGKRREDLRVDAEIETLDRGLDRRSVASRLGDEEEYEQLILLLLRLPERDRRILTLHLRGEPVERIAVELGLERARGRPRIRGSQRVPSPGR